MLVWRLSEGGGCSPALHEDSVRAAGGMQHVGALQSHVVCVSEDRASGTST